MKNILICVSGLTPQIVTETLFCLSVKEKIKVDEIYVLTTKRGREAILGMDKAIQTPKIPLKAEIENLCEKYKITKPLFENNDAHIIVAKEESIELSDIRSDNDNILFPNKIAEFLRNKTIDSANRIFCSITGGRKSMSVHLANALSLFGRENDKLLHVLTSEEKEFKEFYPKNKKEGIQLELSEIPFIRLGFILYHSKEFSEINGMKYVDIVKYTQNKLKVLSSKTKLMLNINLRQISYGHAAIKLEPLEFALYYKFCEAKLDGKNKYTIHELISNDFAISVAEFIKEHYDYYYFSQEIKKPRWQHGFSPENFRSKRSKMNAKASELFEDKIMHDQFSISSNKLYGETSYSIKADKDIIKIIY